MNSSFTEVMRIRLPIWLSACFLPLVSGCFQGVASIGPIELGIIGLVVFLPAIAAIVAIIDINRSDRPGGDKMLLVLLVLMVPLFGALAYFLVGRQN